MKRRTRAVFFILSATWLIASSFRSITWFYGPWKRVEFLGEFLISSWLFAFILSVVGLFLLLRSRTSRPYLRIPQQTSDHSTGATPSQLSCTLRICTSGDYNDWIASISDDVMRLECRPLNRSIVLNRKQRDHLLRFPNVFSDFDLIIEDSAGEKMVVFCDGKRSDAQRIKRWWDWPSIFPKPPPHSPSQASITMPTYAPTKINSSHKNTGTAIASLVCSICGLAYPTSILFFSSIAGIICGHIAISRIKRNPSEYGGFKRAIAGVIIGYIAAALGLVLGFTIASSRMKLRQMGFPI